MVIEFYLKLWSINVFKGLSGLSSLLPAPQNSRGATVSVPSSSKPTNTTTTTNTNNTTAAYQPPKTFVPDVLRKKAGVEAPTSFFSLDNTAADDDSDESEESDEEDEQVPSNEPVEQEEARDGM